MLAPTVHEIADERTDIKVGKINVDQEPELAQQYGIMSIPTLIVIKEGTPVAQSTGVRPKQAILDMIG
jgi:thioredoxin 1